MNGKDKCKILKEIRRQIAESNNINWVVSECSHKGECSGTCPRCEAEVKKLESELESRKRLGKMVAVAGLSLSVISSASGCAPIDSVSDSLNSALHPNSGYSDLAGDVTYIPDSTEDDNSIYSSEICNTEIAVKDYGELDGDVVYMPDYEE